MCGITGLFNYARNEPVDPATVQRMARSIVHRGPDDEGFFISGALGLGFRRLSIIDLSGGHQPMLDAEETVCVVFNGEIYNYKELRAELESHGHKFRTHSDTEAIVHGYKQWGDAVFSRLNGMFGIGLWDIRKRRLLVVRDAMGIKPIYYRDENGSLTFGSEVRAVRAASGRPAEVDPVAVSQFLLYRYTPAPLTIFKGIRKLAPGTMLVAENGTCRVETWYRFTPVPFSEKMSDVEAREQLLSLYRGAVKRHLLADVPVGILLSGGLDSGLLMGLMDEEGKGWHAFTVGYGSTFADDELKEAAETARHFHARHVPIQLDRAEFEATLPRIVDFLEEPVASSSIVPMYHMCQRARQDVKVALIGQGPDELFGGYKRHLGIYYGTYWRKLPAGARKAIGAAINSLRRNETAKRGVYALGIEERLERYQHVFSLAPAETIDGLFRDGVLAPGQSGQRVPYWESLLPEMAHLDELGGFQLLELRSSLPDELLMFGDKVSMAHSLEVRVPYLDRTVVEYGQRLASTFKIRNRKGKWIHREVCKNYLPPAILNRPKRGFGVNVVDGWFNSSMDGLLSDLLLNPRSKMYEILRPEPVKVLLDEHRSGRNDNHKILFSLVMVEQWLRKNVAA
ncbi:MAG TPA: asparagine synthase (glutamine-hydrolyzing) [Candidatus Didemnitutus sp.]|nr:asparagine synthase (glutamine-hydrolyzing) [Candidatus Didemnitutus sp.]